MIVRAIPLSAAICLFVRCFLTHPSLLIRIHSLAICALLWTAIPMKTAQFHMNASFVYVCACSSVMHIHSCVCSSGCLYKAIKRDFTWFDGYGNDLPSVIPALDLAALCLAKRIDDHWARLSKTCHSSHLIHSARLSIRTGKFCYWHVCVHRVYHIYYVFIGHTYEIWTNAQTWKNIDMAVQCSCGIRYTYSHTLEHALIHTLNKCAIATIDSY